MRLEWPLRNCPAPRRRHWRASDTAASDELAGSLLLRVDRTQCNRWDACARPSVTRRPAPDLPTSELYDKLCSSNKGGANGAPRAGHVF